MCLIVCNCVHRRALQCGGIRGQDWGHAAALRSRCPHALTDTAIRKAKPTDKKRRIYDERGLYLEIAPEPAGSKLWRLKYRYDGKEKRLALGAYPDTTLADARAKRDDARRLLAGGTDPSAQRQATKVARVDALGNSFEVVAREWLAIQTFVPGYRKKVSAWFENDVFPWVGASPVSELTAPDFLRVLRRIEERGAIESAHRIKQNCGNVMRYAIATSRAHRDPTADLKGALTRPTERHHAAITDPKDAGGLLRAIAGFNGTPVVKAALQLAPLVFVRPNELCSAEWQEFDLDAAEWNIPASRMKTGQAHLVPLSTQATAILRELHPLTGRGRFTFPSARTPHPSSSQRPMTTNALLAALQRIGYTGNEMTTHGFRAMARTIFISLEDTGEKARSTLRKIAATYQLDPEKVSANVRIFDGTKADAALVTEVNEMGNRKLVPTPMMAETVAACAGADLIAIDNASDGFDGNENDRRQVRGFMRLLAGIARENDAGLMLLAHIDKHAARNNSGGNSYSGSTAWHNSARSRLALVTNEAGDIHLLHEKCNLAKSAEPLLLAWNGDVLVPGLAVSGAREAAADLTAQADAEAVFNVLTLAIAAGVIVPTATAGPATAWHALESLPEHQHLYRNRAGRRRVASALVRLAREGRIEREEYRKPNRHPGERWALTQTPPEVSG